MTDVVARIQSARSVVEQRRAEVARLNAREESFLEDLASFKKKMIDEGIDPASLDAEIKRAEDQIEEELKKLEDTLSG